MKVTEEICNSFNARAATYESAAIVQRTIGERLFERLEYLKMQPQYVLDLGCGPGFFSQQLKKRYPKARIIGLDLAYNMLQEAKAKQGFRKKWPLVNGEMSAMPFQAGLFDLVFANQVIHWSPSLATVIREIHRVMRAEGCFMFSTLGPDTFHELRDAWSCVDTHAHTNDFPDMHTVGDVLLAERFSDPVVDMEMLTAHYRSLPQLLQALKAQGVRNVHRERVPGLMGKQAWRGFEAAMLASGTEEAKLPLSYEVVYGHAWKVASLKRLDNTEVRIPVTQLRTHRSRYIKER